MSKVKIQGNASGTGVVTLTAPNTNTDRTITLPDGDISLGVGIDDNATSTAITIDSGEKVGVGTTAPTAKLDVGGQTDTTPATYGGTIRVGEGTQLDVNKVGGIDLPVADGYGCKIQALSASGAALAFAYRNSNATWTESMRIAATGDVTVNTGNLVIGTSGKGIDFSADGNAAGMTSEVLDDYEEGTWTPVLNDGTNNATAATNGWTHGTYVKVGVMIYLQCTMNTSSLGSVSGTINISGLPFQSSSSYINPITVYGSQMALTTQDTVTGRILSSQSKINLHTWDNAAGVSPMQASEWSANGYANISAMYRAV